MIQDFLAEIFLKLLISNFFYLDIADTNENLTTLWIDATYKAEE